MKYLSGNGLQYFWSKIKPKIESKLSKTDVVYSMQETSAGKALDARVAGDLQQGILDNEEATDSLREFIGVMNDNLSDAETKIKELSDKLKTANSTITDLSSKFNNNVNEIGNIKKEVSSLTDKHNNLSNIAQKKQSVNDLGIKSSDTLVDISTKVSQVKNALAEIWINNATVYGKEVRAELQKLYSEFNGYLFVSWSADYSNCFFEAVEYKTGKRYFKTYTKINGENWGNWNEV